MDECTTHNLWAGQHYSPLHNPHGRWIDDPRFNLEYHVRHTALPRPGDDERLLRLAGRIFSQQLDRSKPLWELWMVEGLADERWALISKTHHALVDGVSGVDLTTMLFDLQPAPRPGDQPGVWVPHPEPSGAELAAASITSAARRTLGLPLRTAALAAQPSNAVAQARETLGGLAEVVRASLTTAPDTPLNVEISPHRRIAIAPAQLDDFKLVKNAFGGTVNDVVLAVVAGALRDWLHSRGMRTEGLEMKACVPVSTRAPEQDGSLGNRITQLIAPLPIHIADPVERLRFVSEAMAGIKDSKQALGAEIIAGAQDFAPPTILAQSSRMNFSTRFYNLLVTNIPGPQFPLYLLGRELQGMYPDRVPRRRSCARHRDHVVQRTHELRPHWRFRRDGRHRGRGRGNHARAQRAHATGRLTEAGRLPCEQTPRGSDPHHSLQACGRFRLFEPIT